MKLDIKTLVDSFNDAVPDSVFGISTDGIVEICGIAPSTWRKYHLRLRQAEQVLLTNKKTPLGFTYERGDGALDRTSTLLIFAFSFLQNFFRNEKVAIKELYKHWEEIKCHANL
jgi:hypothetical protein